MLMYIYILAAQAPGRSVTCGLATPTQKGLFVTSTTAGSQIKFMPNVDGPVKAGLQQALGDTDANELAGKQPHQIVPQIAEALPSANALELARQLLSFLKDMGFGAATAPSLVKSEPQRVIVELSKTLAERTVLDLLTMLAESEGDATQVLAELKSRQQVIDAERKAAGKIVVPTKDGKIDPRATDSYISELAMRFSEPQRKVNKQFPITLDQALNLTRMVTLNPLTFKVNYVGVKDAFGVIISKLPDERYFALLWALLTNHPRMPRTTDEDEIETYLEQIFADEASLKRRWKVIFEDFEEARNSGSLEAQGLIRQMTEAQAEQLLGRLGGSSPITSVRHAVPTPSATVDYERLVREHAALYPADKRISGSYSNISGGICDNLTVSGSSCTVSDMIVLNGGRVSGSYCNVRVFTPPRVSLRESGSSNTAVATPLTWKQLAEKLGLL